jgi:peptide deformylase
MPIRNLLGANSDILNYYVEDVLETEFIKFDNIKVVKGKHLLRILRDMTDTLLSIAKGTDALAANQIGFNKRIYVAIRPIKIDKEIKYEVFEFINPEIISYSDEMVENWESCFSIPGKVFLVERHKEIKIKYNKATGEQKEEELKGFDAIIAQHEIDHLDGILVSSCSKKSMTHDEYMNSKNESESGEKDERLL